MLNPRKTLVEKRTKLEGDVWEVMVIFVEEDKEEGDKVHVVLSHIPPYDDRCAGSNTFVFPIDYYEKKIKELWKKGVCVLWDYGQENIANIWRLIITLNNIRSVRFIVSYERGTGEMIFGPGWTLDQISLPERNPLVIQFKGLLEKHGTLNSPEVRSFYEQHKDDEDFSRRIRRLDIFCELRRKDGMDSYLPYLGDEAP